MNIAWGLDRLHTNLLFLRLWFLSAALVVRGKFDNCSPMLSDFTRQSNLLAIPTFLHHEKIIYDINNVVH